MLPESVHAHSCWGAGESPLGWLCRLPLLETLFKRRCPDSNRRPLRRPTLPSPSVGDAASASQTPWDLVITSGFSSRRGAAGARAEATPLQALGQHPPVLLALLPLPSRALCRADFCGEVGSAVAMLLRLLCRSGAGPMSANMSSLQRTSQCSTSGWHAASTA
jgi:hypothetical protein